MMKEGVVITKISIKRQGERKHFQIKLPSDTKFIIGVENGGRLISQPRGVDVKPNANGIEQRTPFRRNQLVGELKLQSSEESNWFYSADVFGADANLRYGDFSNVGFNVNDYTHGNKRTEEIVKVDAESTIIQGWYLDALGKSQRADINYEVTIYIWINTEE
jgi:hypothetical protein